MELFRECKREFCKGTVQWSVDTETGLEGTCLGCGRPAFRRKVDRTDPGAAELIENSLIWIGRKRS
jgi:hypothetical protein